jgi:hypothetical protein
MAVLSARAAIVAAVSIVRGEAGRQLSCREGRQVVQKVSEVPVQVDELSLSILGWEVQDFRARATSECYDDGDCFHKLAISGVFRFNDEDWTDCFGRREYPPSPVMVLRSPKISPWPAFTALHMEKPKRGRSVRVSANEFFLNSYQAIDQADLRVELTGFDSIQASSYGSEIPIGVKALPIEIVDESTRTAVQLQIDQVDAFTHQAENGNPTKRLGQMRMSGRVTFGTPEELLAEWVSTWRGAIRGTPTVADKAPFERYAPNVSFEVLDETGFLLEQATGDVSIDIPVDKNGHTPSRVPRWLIDLSFDTDDFSAKPDRVIARIEDR